MPSDDSRAADGGAADQDRPLPAEVTGPFVAAGMKEPCALVRFGIDAREILAFMVVVGEAGERQIAGNRLAPHVAPRRRDRSRKGVRRRSAASGNIHNTGERVPGRTPQARCSWQVKRSCWNA
jgi:hypothetical protein